MRQRRVRERRDRPGHRPLVAAGFTVLHTEASLGFGGQELRILAESHWLGEHGIRALIAAQPGSRLLSEAERAGIPAIPMPMRGAWDLAAMCRLRGVARTYGADLVHTHSSID